MLGGKWEEIHKHCEEHRIMDLWRLYAQNLYTLCEHMQAQIRSNAHEFIYVEELAISDQHFIFFCILVGWSKRGLNFSYFQFSY